MTDKQALKTCPFCGVKPKGIEFSTHRGGPSGYVLRIRHEDQCFIEHMSYAYYGTPEDCAAEWNRRNQKSEMTDIYVVHAMRYGNPEKHSYIVLATHSGVKAMAAAKRVEEERGGKYGCVVIEFSGDARETIRKAYNEGETECQ